MEVIDTKTWDVRLSYNPFNDLIGVVIKDEDDIGFDRVGVTIPKLLLGSEDVSEPIDEDIDISDVPLLNSENKTFMKKSVNSTNYAILSIMQINNLGSPRFSKGESVLIKTIDQDIKSMAIYPYTIFAQESYRAKQGDSFQVFVPAMNSSKDSNIPVTKENSYHFNVDSRKDKQLISISTSKDNGEKAALNFTLDAKNGVIGMTTPGSKLAMAFNVPEDKILFYTDDEASIEAKGDTVTIVASKINIKGEQEINIDTKNLNIKSDNMKINSKVGEFKIKKFTQTSTSGTFKITDYVSECMNIRMKSTIGYMVESPVSIHSGVIGGASLTFGSMPPSPTGLSPSPDNTMSIPSGKVKMDKGNFEMTSGSMSMGGGTPLVKYPSFANIITAIGSLIDAAGLAAPGTVLGASGILSSMTPSSATKSTRLG